MSCETDKYDQAVEQGAPGKQVLELKRFKKLNFII